MDSTAIPVVTEIDPSKKDATYINNSLTRLRIYGRPFVSRLRVRKNKQILFGQQPMDKVKAEFKDKLFLANTDFIPLGIWNRILNIIIEELTKAPPRVELKATDSTAISDKKDDILLLRSKHIYEADINAANAKIGDPPEIIGKDKFKGNIEEFERLDLDPNDPDDINFYEQSGFQRLRFEIAGQKLINNIMKLNRFDKDTLRRFVIDILSTLTVSMQIYVDAISGEIKYKYIAPESAWGIFGDSEDGSDDICHGKEDQITIADWLRQVGDDFNWDRDWRKLLGAINQYNGWKYTGFVRWGTQYDCCSETDCMASMGITGSNSNCVNWDMAYGFKILCGYAEWSTMEATATYLKKHGSDELLDRVDFNYEIGNKKEQKQYFKESFYQEQWYRTNYLVTGSTTQMIYNWGKVYYQTLYGANDEYSRGTMLMYRYEGMSAAEISEPFISLANSSFYRMKWVVSKAKPQSEEYLYNELIEISKGFQKQFPQSTNGTGGINQTPTVQNIMQQAIQYQHENNVRIRFFPQVEGKVMPQVPQFAERKNGIDPITIGLQAITQWCEMQIAEKIGLNDMRLGSVKSDREGYKVNVAETQSSLNSTGYVYRMLQYTKEHAAVVTLNYAQDIVKFEDSIPYKWLQKLMGFENFDALKLLKDFAAHRFGIYVDDYNAELEKQMFVQLVNKSVDSGDGRGGLNPIQAGLLLMEEDYKQGFKLLNYLNYKAEKKKRRQELQNFQIQQDNSMALLNKEQEIEQMKIQGLLAGKQMDADAIIKSAQIAAAGKIQVKGMTNDAEEPKQNAKANADKQVLDKEAELKQQESLITSQ